MNECPRPAAGPGSDTRGAWRMPATFGESGREAGPPASPREPAS